jgi:addiction module HigA family antidote
MRARQPAHPGRILKNMYIKPLGITITMLADTLNVSRKALSMIINEHKTVTTEMALRLSQAFDTTPDLWLNLQKNYDLFHARQNLKGWRAIRKIKDTLESVQNPT